MSFCIFNLFLIDSCLAGFCDWVIRYRRFFPLHGLMASRYRGEDAFAATLAEREFHPRDSSVIEYLLSLDG